MKQNNDILIGQIIASVVVFGCIIWFAYLVIDGAYKQMHPQNKLINIEPIK